MDNKPTKAEIKHLAYRMRKEMFPTTHFEFMSVPDSLFDRYIELAGKLLTGEFKINE